MNSTPGSILHHTHAFGRTETDAGKMRNDPSRINGLANTSAKRFAACWQFSVALAGFRSAAHAKSSEMGHSDLESSVHLNFDLDF